MRYIWIVSMLLVCAWQTAHADPRPIPGDSLDCRSVVVGTFHTTSKELELNGPIDSVTDVYLYGSGQQRAFEIMGWEWRPNSSSIMLHVQFSPKAASMYENSIAIVVAMQQSKPDTLLLTVKGRGIHLRAEPKHVDFGEMWTNAKDKKLTLKLYNDGVTVVPMQLRLQNGGANSPFSFNPDLVDIRGMDFGDFALEIEVTCSAKGQKFDDFIRAVKDSLLIEIGDGTVLATQVVPLSVQFVKPSEDSSSLAFENVLIGTSRTMTVSYTNRSNNTITIPRPEVINSNREVFRHIDSVEEHILRPGDVLNADVEFAPDEPGKKSGQLLLFARLENQGLVLLKTVNLEGNGFTFDNPQVTTGTARVKVDEQFQFPITVRFNEKDVNILRQSNVRDLHYRLPIQLNASIAKVLGNNIDSVTFQGGTQTVYLSGTLAVANLQPVLSLSLEMHALLGDTDSSSVSGDTILWTIPGTGFVRKGEMEEGAIVLTDVFVWPNGQKRLINTRKGTLRLELTPNPVPATGTVMISASGFSDNAMLTIYTSVGAEVYRRELTSSVPVPLNVGSLSIGAGIYYCRLSSGRNSLVKLLQVE